MIVTKKLATLALAGLLSVSPLAAFAASDTANPTGTPETPSGKPVTQGMEKSTTDGDAKGIDGKEGSMSSGADSGTTDGGPSTLGGSKGDGGSGSGTGGGASK